MRIFVTGATGFIGQCVVRTLARRGYSVQALMRKQGRKIIGAAGYTVADLLSPKVDWIHCLRGVDAVVHLAARVHVMKDAASDPMQEFRALNVVGTNRLATAAAAAGVQRFIFVSTIKVNGERTGRTGLPPFFTADDEPHPCDAYSTSKLEAEQCLIEIAKDSKLDVTILRPALVYGPGVKGNFLYMMNYLHRGVPLPFKSIDNKRSLIGLCNLADLIVTSIERPSAANQIFLASDGEDLSTTELLIRLGLALGRPARLFGLPTWAIKSAATLVGRRAASQRLCESLQVDIAKTESILAWRPPETVDDTLLVTAQRYLQSLTR